jgi:hypothetical protein
MKEERNKIKSDWDLYGSYATKALNAHERMKELRDAKWRRGFLKIAKPGTSELYIKELLVVAKAATPIIVGDEAEKILAKLRTPKKKWYPMENKWR